MALQLATSVGVRAGGVPMGDAWVDAAEDAARAKIAALAIDPREDAANVHRIVQDAVDGFADGVAPDEREDAITRLMAVFCGYGPIQPYLDDPGVQEIWLNSPSLIHKGSLQWRHSSDLYERRSARFWGPSGFT